MRLRFIYITYDYQKFYHCLFQYYKENRTFAARLRDKFSPNKAEKIHFKFH